MSTDTPRAGAALDAAADADRPRQRELQRIHAVAISERRKKTEAQRDAAREREAAATPYTLTGRAVFIVAACLVSCLLWGAAWWGCVLLLERAF